MSVSEIRLNKFHKVTLCYKLIQTKNVHDALYFADIPISYPDNLHNIY